jgi:cytidylate kinase
MPRPFVIDGRDMGSVVFPDAAHKFYLTAAPEVRAARRVGERSADLSEVAAAIRRRDALDARQLAPAPDAQHLDTSALDLDAVVAWVLARLSLAAPT